jgi:hypothetical protein
MHTRLAVLAWWGPLVGDGRRCLQLMRTARAIRGAWLPWIYKSKEGEGGVPYLAIQHCCPYAFRSPSPAPCLFAFVRRPPCLCSPPLTAMAPTQPIHMLDPLPWHHSTVMDFALNELVTGGQLVPNLEGQPPVWIIPPAADREPNPSFSYVVSFIRHHERGFTAPASRFMRGLCHHYGVELHNFAPNEISQVATSSTRSCTRSPRTNHKCVGRYAPAACRSRCGTRVGSFTSPAR